MQSVCVGSACRSPHIIGLRTLAPVTLSSAATGALTHFLQPVALVVGSCPTFLLQWHNGGGGVVVSLK